MKLCPDSSTEAPLLGVRILEILSGKKRYIGRILSDLGADVTSFEVHPLANQKEATDSEYEDLESLVLNRGKTVHKVDVEYLQQYLKNSLSGYDVLIEDLSVGSNDVIFDHLSLSTEVPHLVMLSVSDFGQGNDFEGWIATDPVLHALSGELSRSGIPGNEPLLPPGALPSYCASTQAAFVVLLAYYQSLVTARGGHIDFSMLDGVVQTLDPGFGVAGSAAAGIRASELPRGRPEARFQYPIIECKDGYVRICVLAARQWRGMFKWMGEPEKFSDPSYDNIMTRFKCPDLIPEIARFFADKGVSELVNEGQKFGVPIAPLKSLHDAISTDHNLSREAFSSLALSSGKRVQVSRGPIIIDGQRLDRRSPDDRGLATTREQKQSEQPLWAGFDSNAVHNGQPLAGLRVIDMGVIVVGAETGRLLGDAGADVVKIENAAFPDGIRQTRDGSLMSPSFAAGQRNKRSLCLDLRSEKGKEVFTALLGEADILLSNFKPGTLDSLGFDERRLRDINPRLISVDSSAFGATGPDSRSLGYGPLVRAASGITGLWTYNGEKGSFSDAVTVYPDHVAARFGALTAISLLIRRRRLDVGGNGSISQAEVILDHLNIDYLAAQAVGDSTDESDLCRDVPWGVFRCAGDDEWCVVTVRNSEDWRSISDLIGLGEQQSLWSRKERFANRHQIEHALEDWLRQRSPSEAMIEMQARGIPAGGMLRVSDMPEFDYYMQRDFFKVVTHPNLEEPFIVEARAAKTALFQDPLNQPAPLMGEHSRVILKDWLNLLDEDIDQLENDKIIINYER